MQIIYFGAPGDGFESYPIEFINSFAAFDKSHLEYGEIECKYIRRQNSVDIIYVIYGLGGEGDGSYRKGRNFGVCIRLDGKEVKKSERQNLHEFLNRFIYEGVNQEAVGLFTPNDGKIVDFAVKSLQSSSQILDQLSSSLKQHFDQEFGNSLKKIKNSISYTEELDPFKIKIKNFDAKENKEKVRVNGPAEKYNSNISDPKSEPINKPTTSLLNWMFLLFIPLFGLSIFNFIQHNKLKEKVKENIQNINQLEEGYTKKNKNKQISGSNKKCIRLKENNGKRQYYLINSMIPSEQNPSISSVEEYISHLSKLINDSNELPFDKSQSDYERYITENNSQDLTKIKNQIEEKKKQQPNGVYFSDIILSSNILIWQE